MKTPVIMSRTTATAWAVLDPDGAPVDISSSDTQGLQEAIDLACDSDAGLFVNGGGSDAIIFCSAPITWPAMRIKSIRMHGVTIDVTPGGSNPSFRFDSCMMVDFEMSGQIVHHGVGPAVLFSPENPVVYDNVVTCTVSAFRFGAIACMNENGAAGVRFAGSGPMDRNRFSFMEVNGKNDHTGVQSYHGIEICPPTAGFVGNTLLSQNIHGFKGSSLRVGTGSTSAIYGNRYQCTIAPKSAGGGAVGAQVYSQNDDFKLAILNNEGTCDVGIKLEASSTGCYFIVPRNNSTTKKQIVSPATYKGWLGD